VKPSKESLTLFGSIVAAVAASACCIGPVVVAVLGLGGAAFGVWLEPLRPVFAVLTLGLLGLAFYFVYRPAAATACGVDGACHAPGSKRAIKTALWIATFLALVFLAFPYYAAYLV
jgi:mercuric ion transport protein